MEPPGTAPGSEPLITSAFMSIVPKDMTKLGSRGMNCKGRDAVKFLYKRRSATICYLAELCILGRSISLSDVPCGPSSENTFRQSLGLRLKCAQTIRYCCAILRFHRIGNILM